MLLKQKSSDIMSEVRKIVETEPGKPRTVYYDAELVINPKYDKNSKKEFILICKTIVAMDIKRDYESGRSDVITTIFQMPLGDTVKVIYPNRDNIVMRLTRYGRGGPVVNDYRCLITKIDENVKNNTYIKESMDDLNGAGMTAIEAQLVAPLTLQLRKEETSGIYKDNNVRDVLSSELGLMMEKATKKVNIGKWELVVLPHDNSRKYEHVVIPSGTKTMDIPQLFQEGEQGVYNGGINTYVQEIDGVMKMFVYPLFRPTHANYKQPKLIIYGVRDSWNMNIDSTWAFDENKNLQIVVKASSKLHADDNIILNKGNEFRVSDSETMLARPFKVEHDKLTAIPEAINRTFKHRRIAYDSAPTTVRQNESNNFNLRSGVLADDMIKLPIKWIYSDYTSLHPVMPVEYIEELEDGTVDKYEGVINTVDVFTDQKRKVEEVNMLVHLKRKSVVGKPIVNKIN